MEKYKITWFSAVPTIHQIILTISANKKSEEVKRICSQLRFIRSCSSSLSSKTFKELKNLFNVPVLEAYGMTEASHQTCSNPLPSKGIAKCGSVGVHTHLELEIISKEGHILPRGQTGEVIIRGPSVITTYWKNSLAHQSSSFTQDGWFRTGDEGYLDNDNYLFLTGRLKEIINRGGEKISPIEVEEIFWKHAAIEEVVVFGIPSEKYGEEVSAIVVLKKDYKNSISEKNLIDHCKSFLASFKVPQKILTHDSIPKNSTGKVSRTFLTNLFGKEIRSKL